MVSPLKDPQRINDRLDAVTDLVKQEALRDKLQARLKKVPDLERMLSRVYTYSQQTSVKAIYIDVGVIARLDEFHKLLSVLGVVRDTVTDIFTKDVVKGIKSKRLKALVTFKGKRDKVNLMPDYGDLLDEFKSMIQWKAVGTKKIPEPTPG